jgi:small subunit ribosomal protein S6
MGARAPELDLDSEIKGMSARPGGDALREYETTIIVQPEISDDGTAAIFERLDRTFDEHESVRLMCENLGKRKLAYEIRKFHKGHYYVLSFLDDGQVIPDFERVLRLNESVLRFMTIQTDPEVADIEARKAAGAEADAEQTRKAEERALREEEEAKARAEIERVAAEEAAVAAKAAEAEAVAAAAEGDSGESAEAAASEGEAAPVEAAASSEAAPSSDAKPAKTEAAPSSDAKPAKTEAAPSSDAKPAKTEADGDDASASSKEESS